MSAETTEPNLENHTFHPPHRLRRAGRRHLNHRTSASEGHDEIQAGTQVAGSPHGTGDNGKTR